MADGNEFMGWLVGGVLLTDQPVRVKELSLDEAGSKIRQAVYDKLRPAPSALPAFASPAPSYGPDLYVVAVYAGYVIIEKGADHFKVPFTVQEGGVVVSDLMIPVEQVWVEKAPSEAVPTE